MIIFEYENYKIYTLDLIQAMPKNGHGQFRKIAEHLGVNSVLISQVFKGERELSFEQAFELTHYFGLSELETQYYLLMVQIQRAGTQKLKRYHQTQLRNLKRKSHQLHNRVPRDQVLTEEAKAIFYSSWHYSAIRLLTSINGFQSIDTIANHLKLPLGTVKKAVQFLLEHRLCIEKNGLLRMGPQMTHLEAASPLITRHHTNWRLKGIQSMEIVDDHELFYSAPMALSFDLRAKIRERLISMIGEILKEVKDSPSECLACLNFDWFDFRSQ